MNKLLSDTRIVAALVALVVVCLTVLAALGKVPGVDVVKMLGAFLLGVIVSWNRGAVPPAPEAAAEVKKEEPKTPVPPVLPLLGICLAFLFLPGASCAGAKPVIRTVNDIAAEWCAAHYASLNGISVEDAVKTFCTGEEALKPWLDLILMGQKNGVDRMGVSKDKCEVTVTKDVPVADAGKD